MAWGGIGKTTLAMVYVAEYYTKYKHIAWVTLSENNFIDDFVHTEGLLGALNLEFNESSEKTFETLIQKLKTLPETSLLIIDNANENLADYYHKLPNKPNWHLLVTSREVIAHFTVFKLGFLDEEDAFTLFKNYYKHKDISDSDIKVLLANIEYHTLTIEILAKTAQEQRLSFLEINNAINCDLATDIRIDHQNKKIEKIFTYLANTFTMSKLDEAEINLLNYLSCLPREYIPYKELKEVFTFKKDLAKTLSSLQKKGWVSYLETEDSYKLHQIIIEITQQINKKTIDSTVFIDPLIKKVSSLLSLDEDPNKKDHRIYKQIWVKYGKTLLKQNKQKNKKIISTLQNNLALVLKDLGDYHGAKKLLEKAKKSDEINFGKEHPTTAVRYSNLGLVLQALGDYHGAKELLEKAKKSDEINFGKNHPTTAVSYSNLATVIKALGDYQGAKKLLEKTKKSAEINLGKEHPTTAVRYSNLAVVLQDLGDYHGAKKLLEKAKKSNEINFGKEHPTTAGSYSNLGLVLQGLGDYHGAKELLEKVKKSNEINFGKDHPTTALSYSNLAMVLLALDDYHGAKELLEKALAIFVQVLGENHPNTQTVRGNLEYVITKMNK